MNVRRVLLSRFIVPDYDLPRYVMTKPIIGQAYAYVEERQPVLTTWQGTEQDKYRFEQGNVFPGLMEAAYFLKCKEKRLHVPKEDRRLFIRRASLAIQGHCPPPADPCPVCDRILLVKQAEERPRSDKRGGFRSYARQQDVIRLNLLIDLLTPDDR